MKVMMLTWPAFRAQVSSSLHPSLDRVQMCTCSTEQAAHLSRQSSPTSTPQNESRTEHRIQMRRQSRSSHSLLHQSGRTEPANGAYFRGVDRGTADGDECGGAAADDGRSNEALCQTALCAARRRSSPIRLASGKASERGGELSTHGRVRSSKRPLMESDNLVSMLVLFMLAGCTCLHCLDSLNQYGTDTLHL